MQSGLTPTKSHLWLHSVQRGLTPSQGWQNANLTVQRGLTPSHRWLNVNLTVQRGLTPSHGWCNVNLTAQRGLTPSNFFTICCFLTLLIASWICWWVDGTHNKVWLSPEAKNNSSFHKLSPIFEYPSSSNKYKDGHQTINIGQQNLMFKTKCHGSYCRVP